jgi:hypothetical protein
LGWGWRPVPGQQFVDAIDRVVGDSAITSASHESALVDGEAVAVRPDRHSDFAALRTKAGSARACFVAFDLLNLNGEDFRKRPIEERRAALSPLVAGVHCTCSVTPWWPRERSCSPRPASWAWRGSSRSAPAADIRAELKAKNPEYARR